MVRCISPWTAPTEWETYCSLRFVVGTPRRCVQLSNWKFLSFIAKMDAFPRIPTSGLKVNSLRNTSKKPDSAICKELISSKASHVYPPYSYPTTSNPSISYKIDGCLIDGFSIQCYGRDIDVVRINLQEAEVGSSCEELAAFQLNAHVIEHARSTA